MQEGTYCKMEIDDVKTLMQHDLQVMIADRNEGKSHFLYDIMRLVNEHYPTPFNKKCFGVDEEMANNYGFVNLYTVRELELCEDTLIIIDEVNQLFDLDDRKNARMVENFFRVLAHKNNRVLLCGLPRDFKKFICSSAKGFAFKRVQIGDLINGSFAKQLIKEYKGKEKENFQLNAPKKMTLYYDGTEWHKFTTEYNEQHDTKKHNKRFF